MEGNRRIVSSNCVKVGALSLSPPMLLLFRSNNLFGCDLGNHTKSINAPSTVERPPSDGNISSGDCRIKTSNNYTTGIIVLLAMLSFG